ncbi:MAG: 16S rRNA (adenine(1518)-N(6)/adenine(1519)-N(6))-dimethyltransferase RsmA [Candidatus Micrarchaeota archaeon]|nr:16S rRNA (adenine(1518)-N(6)/adenine(1519)-N(6))-dimethyltransferase RsmA [Candidatus Micrarchaeota archaeon]
MRQKLGQHFLWDSQIIRQIASHADIAGKNVLEIGAGAGALTEALAHRKPKKLVALETDEALLPKLEKRTKGLGVTILHANARNLDFKGYHWIVGNIPFYLSSELLFKTIHTKSHALFLVQKEFGERLVAEPGSNEWGRLSVNAQNRADVKIVMDVSRFSFSPPPEVDAVVVLLTAKRPKAIDEKLVEALFSHKNQKVKKAFTNSAKKLGYEKKEAKAFALHLPFAEMRVKDLTPEQWVELSAHAGAQKMNPPEGGG